MSLSNYNTKRTSQVNKARGDQKQNNAGGFVFTLDDAKRLERFLILGVDGGTYYASEHDVTKDNAEFVLDLAAANPDLVLETAVAVSKEGRAYRNQPAIFAIAAVLAKGPQDSKAAAKEAVQDVCRTSTHLFTLAQFIENLGGWGRAKREAVAQWYENKTADQLALQAVKYRQRDGWTHRDLLRLSHAVPGNNAVAQFILGRSEISEEARPAVLDGYLEMGLAEDLTGVLHVLHKYPQLPWETIDTKYLNCPEVWYQLLANKAIGGVALLRQTRRFNQIGVFANTDFRKTYIKLMTDREFIRKNRVHPVQFLLAKSGSTFAHKAVEDAVENGFYEAFKEIEPTGKTTLLALDVSGSMSWTAGKLGITAAQVAAVMAMVTARTEPDYNIVGFANGLRDLGIRANMSLDEVLRKTDVATFGSTDCSLPMTWAQTHMPDTESFAVYTDNETYAGRIHPFQALREYRTKTGKNAKLAVVGVTATEFTIADPSDPGMLDVVGFDTNAPAVMADFFRN